MTRKLLDGSLTAGRSRIKDGSTTGLRVDEVPEKGRGVFADRKFARGDFIDEYDGELISSDEAKKRESEYLLNPSVGTSFMFFFQYKNRRLCIDATSESGKDGRLINHSSKSSNLSTKLIEIDEVPQLYFVASRSIPKISKEKPV